jgi:hypothetical protein
MLNTRIDVSDLARAALAYEAIEMDLSLKDAASNAILKGVTKESLRLARLKMGEKPVTEKPMEMTKGPIPVASVTLHRTLPSIDDVSPEDLAKAQILAEKVIAESRSKVFNVTPIRLGKKCPIDDDKDAMEFIDANRGKMSGAEIAKALGRSKSSVNKWIAEKTDA